MSRYLIPKPPVGSAFGRWTVVSPADLHIGKRPAVLCRCQCGTEKPVAVCELQSGRTNGCRSCGPGKHGLSQARTPTYAAWMDMRNRCSNPNIEEYRHYGGRGITASPLWDSYPRFLADVGERPSAEHSLDRIDNNGNYEPGNVRWTTRHTQNRNKRVNRWIEFNGETLVARDWELRLGMKKGTLKSRLEDGWTVERALTTPVKHYRPRK